MRFTLIETDELLQMRENIRRSVTALELCESCSKVSECEPAIVRDGPHAWRCDRCATENRREYALQLGSQVWLTVFQELR